jgi:uncharacterized membrane protein YhaH (DUF805 family)
MIMEWMLLPLRRYAEFSGRSRRKEFWMFVLFQILVSIVFGLLAGLAGGASMATMATSADPTAGVFASIMGMGIILVINLVVSLALIIPSIAVTVRRLHDTDRSGLWLLAPIGIAILAIVALQINETLAVVFFVAYFAMAIALLVFMFLEGTRGPNRYGEDPKGTTNAEVFA